MESNTTKRDWNILGWAVVSIAGAGLIVFYSVKERRELTDFKLTAATTDGVVTSAQPGLQSRDDNEPPSIDYQFKVDGRKYTGTSQLYLPEGKSVQVEYDPSDPSKNVAVGHHDELLLKLVMAGLFGCVGVYLFIFGYSETTHQMIERDRFGVSSLESTPFVRFPIVVLCAATWFILFNAWVEIQPYAYYQILRWLTCSTAIMIAVFAYRWGNRWVPWVFGAMAILFNPIAPIHFERERWEGIDFLASIVFAIAAFKLKPPELFVETNTVGSPGCLE
jgi:hypothetical protein